MQNDPDSLGRSCVGIFQQDISTLIPFFYLHYSHGGTMQYHVDHYMLKIRGLLRGNDSQDSLLSPSYAITDL